MGNACTCNVQVLTCQDMTILLALESEGAVGEHIDVALGSEIKIFGYTHIERTPNL